MKLTQYRSIPSLKKGQKQFAGRNNTGHITTRHRGSGHKQNYRIINWSRNYGDGIVVGFEYDPQRTARIAKIYHSNNQFSYILAPAGRQLFQKLFVTDTKFFINKINGNYKLYQPGDFSTLGSYEVGDFIHNVEITPGSGSIFARAAGSFCQIRSHTIQSSSNLEKSAMQYIKVRLPSGSQRLISSKAFATVGIVSSKENMTSSNLYKARIIKKAGYHRWLGWRPSVRGVARNPVDHPHGGGQGKTSGGRPSVTFKAWPTKGQPTRSIKTKNKLILTRRK